MSEGSKMGVKSLVYAKVSTHPWWPGRIVKQLTQDNQPVYKVHFFGDPSYSYLFAPSLIPFQQFQPAFNQNFPFDFKLNKAIRLANDAYNRKIRQQDAAALYSPECAPERGEVYSSSKMEGQIQNNIDTEEKTQIFQFQQQPRQPNSLQTYLATSLGIHNVIQFLQSPNFALLTSKGTRSKQTIAFRQQLKTKLLKKYNLLDIPKQQKETTTECQAKLLKKHVIILKARHSKKTVQKKRMKRQQVEASAKRRIYGQLLKKNKCVEISRTYAIEIMEHLRTASEDNEHAYARMYVGVMKWISAQESLNESDMQYLNHTLLSRMAEEDRKEDDDKSKLTQATNG